MTAMPWMPVVDGQMLLEDALVRVEAHATPLWNAAAYACGAQLSAQHPTWSADDLWCLLEHRYPEIVTHEPRALGPVIQRLKRAGLIEADPVRYVKSSRPQCHTRPIPVYRSVR